LHYLTVQDILWINLQVTGKVHHFNYAKLEEATYYQYAYGESKDLVAQAARFLPGFLVMNPIDEGNAATIFVATLAFLKINGMHVELQDGAALDWFNTVKEMRKAAIEAIKAIASPSDDHHGSTDVRSAIRGLLGEYPCTILKLQGA
jgi:prophage maintenance system killer protein